MQPVSQDNIDSVVVAGGKATRINGIDKALLPLGLMGQSLLTEVIQACPGKVIVVGQPRENIVGVTWVSDLVEGGGPASGIWAGLGEVETDYVFISAADQQITKEIVNKICDAAKGNDGAWAIRSNGLGQPLLACVRADLLRELLAQTQGINASPLRLMQQLNMVSVKVNEDQIQDVDTWADVAKVAKGTGMNDVTSVWLKQVAAILEIPEEQVPVDTLLELTRDVAHNVERKSAPLTTFLIGLAAGKTGADQKELISRISSAVNDWISTADQAKDE